jgi:hypothetical protein
VRDRTSTQESETMPRSVYLHLTPRTVARILGDPMTSDRRWRVIDYDPDELVAVIPAGAQVARP